MSIDGRAELQAHLKADSSVTDIVGTAIYSIPVVKNKTAAKAISMYLTSPTAGSNTIGIYRNTINCWTKTYADSEALQEAVFQSVNRAGYGGNTFFKCDKLQVIPPQETGGDYNAPVEVLVRIRQGGF